MSKEFNPIMSEVLGSPTKMKILDFLMFSAYFDYSIPELCCMLGISRQTISSSMEPLVKYGLVEVSRKVEKSNMYRYSESEVGETFREFSQALMKYTITNVESILRNIGDKMVSINMGCCPKLCGVHIPSIRENLRGGSLMECPNCKTIHRADSVLHRFIVSLLFDKDVTFECDDELPEMEFVVKMVK